VRYQTAFEHQMPSALNVKPNAHSTDDPRYRSHQRTRCLLVINYNLLLLLIHYFLRSHSQRCHRIQEIAPNAMILY